MELGPKTAAALARDSEQSKEAEQADRERVCYLDAADKKYRQLHGQMEITKREIVLALLEEH